MGAGLMKRALLIAGKVIRWIVIAVCVLLCIFIIYSLIQRAMGNNMPTVFGYAGTTVVTGSMDDDSGDDDIEIGDFIIIRAQDSYGIEDVVTFYDASANMTVTHRVVDIDGTTYYIRGDTTGKRDENDRPITEGVVTDAVPLENIIGKVVGVISGGGNAIDFMRSTPGLLIIVAAGVIIWFAEDIISSLLNRQKEDEEKED